MELTPVLGAVLRAVVSAALAGSAPHTAAVLHQAPVALVPAPSASTSVHAGASGGDQRNGVPAQRDAVVPSGDQRDAVVGTPNEVVEILGKKAELGVQGVMLQWLDMDDISGLEVIASQVLPQL